MAPGVIRQPASVTLGIALAAIVATGCGIGASRSPAPSPGMTSSPAPTVSTTLAQARGQVVRALEAAGVPAGEPREPYRPAESPEFAAAPRAVVQAQLSQDLTAGYVSIYEFASVEAASEAARGQAAYLSSGPGRVQFPTGTRFVVRQLGSAVVFHAWNPSSAEDPQAADIAAALETIGTAIDVPS